jgi:hypothetical protein
MTLTATPPTAPPPTGHRPRGRTAWIAVGSVIGVATLLWGCFQVLIAWAYASETQHEIYTEPIHTIDIDGTGRVIITGADVDVVDVKTKIRRGLQDTDHSATVEGDRLVLRSDCSALLTNYCSTDWTITAPHDVSVVVRTDDGRVTVSDVTGPVDLASDHGKVEAIRVPGATKLRSDHGSVAVSGSTAATVDAATDHGSVRLELAAVPTSVVGRSDHGDVTVVVPAGDEGYAVDAASDNGRRDVGVRSDPSSPRTITARSDHGDVSVTYSSA